MNSSHTDALRAYLNLLEKNVSKRADLSLKEHFARQLVSTLNDESVTPASYRRAVDLLLDALPGEYKADAVLVAREFFPFLVSDIKTVVAMMKTGGYRGFSEKSSVIIDENIKSMPDLITISGGQAYSDERIALYDQYQTCLRSLGADENAVAMRGRIAKALLYLSRDTDVMPGQYRAAIDSTMALLTTEDARLFFVLVAREFYHFLTANPDATGRVNVGASYQSQDPFG